MLHRDGAVAGELWNAVGRNIAPGASRRLGDDELLVPLDRFLAMRNWLGQALTTYSCEALFDDNLLALLRRHDDERHEVALALAGANPPLNAAEVAELLQGSRFQRPLRTFQLRDLGLILSLSHGANFSVPGAGKTTVGYATYEAERMRARVDRLLVVAPLSAFDAWVEEAAECLSPVPVVARFDGRIARRAEVVLVNYQRLVARYDQVATWVLSGNTQVILDEAHRMKRGRGGEWGSACLNLGHLAVRRDILTGTPAPQHPNDFEALMEFLWPHQSRRILPAGVDIADPPPTVMSDVSRRLRPLFARTRKDELGLDPPDLRVELVAMKPLQREIYAALRTRMGRAMQSLRDRTLFGDLGVIVMYLLEAATNPALLASALGSTPSHASWPPQPIPDGSTLADKVRRYGEYETPAKFETLAAMIAENVRLGRKMLVWSNFVANLLELERVLSPHKPALIYGAIPSGEEVDEGAVTREGELRRFRQNDDCRVLLANPAAMAEGVSLHHVCHDAIYVDRTFNAGQYLQSIDRIHRLGLPAGTETRITFLVSDGTIDETVDDRVRIKAGRLAAMLSDPNLVTMALPDEDAYGSWVDAEDIDALLAHLGDA